MRLNPFDDARQHASRRRPFFEGWYFKHAGESCAFAAIPGIYRGQDKSQDHAFVQILFSSPPENRFVPYPVEAFLCEEQGFEVRIGPNIFSLEGIRLSIPEIGLEAALTYDHHVLLQTSLFSPTIMGPFAYLPGMQCRHGVLSLWHGVNGEVCYQQRRLAFSGADGYIEKDWGGVFPESWVWMQCGNHDVTLMCAVATIPLKPIHFTGVICVLRIGTKQFRFATYNGVHISRLDLKADAVRVEMERKGQRLSIEACNNEFGFLQAPSRTGMDRRISESVSARFRVEMLDHGETLLCGEYTGGLEMLEAQGIRVRQTREKR